MKVLVIGDAIIDEFFYGSVTRHSPEDASAPVVDMLDGCEKKLGGCLNVAMNLAALGAEMVYVSTILEQAHMNWLENSNIDTTFCAEGSTLLKQRIINAKTGRHVARLDFNKHFPDEDVFVYKNFISERFCDNESLNLFDAIVVSDYGKGVMDDFWIKKLENCTVPVFIDTKNPHLSIWSKISNSILKMNCPEFLMSDFSMAKYPVVVTDGKHGARLWTGDLSVETIPTTPVKNPDVVGAGDVFLAALSIRYVETKDIREAIKFANVAAGISCTKPGTAVVTRLEVEGGRHS